MLNSLLPFIAVLVAALTRPLDSPRVIAEGDWSKPVSDNRGVALRGRLVLCEKKGYSGRRDFVVYVELQDAREFIGNTINIFCDFGKTDFRSEHKSGLSCEMLDKDKKPVESTGYPFGGAVPLSEWVKLPTDGTIRLRATPFGIYREKAMAISPELNKLWVINDGDRREYFMSGTFTANLTVIPPTLTNENIWRGTLVLPPIRIVNLAR